MCCRKAFSLVEVLVVLVILGLLASVATLNMRHYMVKGKQTAARSDIATIVIALEAFHTIHDRFPSNEEGLAVLIGQGLDRLPPDPWGRPYQYNSPGRGGPYEVISYGADGREGGSGADADITSDNLGNERSREP